jgi:hypothetical protein
MAISASGFADTAAISATFFATKYRSAHSRICRN